MIIFEAMLVPGHFSNEVQSSKAASWAAGSAGGKLDEEPEDDEHGNSERLGSELHTSRTERLLACLLYTSPSPRDRQKSRMPSSA